jgi:hypothetical protein
VWVAGFYGAAKPLRRAAQHQGLFPVNLEHSDQFAELATRVTALRPGKPGSTPPSPTTSSPPFHPAAIRHRTPRSGPRGGWSSSL